MTQNSIIQGVNMFRLLVLVLSLNIVFCVDPELIVPLKELNEACGYDACPVPMSTDGINVHIVPHTHYELGMSRTFAQHYTGEDVLREYFGKSEINMKKTLDTVITEMYAQTYRRFTLSDFPYLFHWWSQRDTNVRKMVHELVRQGRLSFVGGGWSMNDEASTTYQGIIDSFTYSLRKLNATFGECGRPAAAWQADVMGHSKEFASLIAQMGYDAMFINSISFDDELARMRRWGMEMVWRGSDDLGARSDIFTHKLFDGFWHPPGFCFSLLCEDPLLVTSSATFNNVEQRAKEFEESIYNRQSPSYNSSHVLVIMGVALGYFDASYWFANIDALIEAVNNRRGVQKKKKMYLMYSSPACYAKAVHDERIQFETKQDDFYPVAMDGTSYLTGVYTTSPSTKLMAREVTVYLQMCKQMNVLANLGHKYNKMFEDLNWIAGVFQDHNVITGMTATHVNEYYREMMYINIQKSTTLLITAWNELRGCPNTTLYYRCSFNTSSCHTINGEYYFLHVHNVLAWAVNVPVRMPVEYFGEEIIVYNPKGSIVKSAIIKIPTPVQDMPGRNNSANYEVVFRAKKIPPLGFKTYFMHRVFPKRDKKHITKKTRDYFRGKLVKNIGTPTKKYLIRQTQPLIEDQTMIYDLNDEYEDSTKDFTMDISTKDYSMDIANVTLLLESDTDEEQLQQLTHPDEVDIDDIEVIRHVTVIPSTLATVTELNIQHQNPVPTDQILISSDSPLNKSTTQEGSSERTWTEKSKNVTIVQEFIEQSTTPLVLEETKLQNFDVTENSLIKVGQKWVKNNESYSIKPRLRTQVTRKKYYEAIKPTRTTTPTAPTTPKYDKAKILINAYFKDDSDKDINNETKIEVENEIKIIEEEQDPLKDITVERVDNKEEEIPRRQWSPKEKIEKDPQKAITVERVDNKKEEILRRPWAPEEKMERVPQKDITVKRIDNKEEGIPMRQWAPEEKLEKVPQKDITVKRVDNKEEEISRRQWAPEELIENEPVPKEGDSFVGNTTDKVAEMGPPAWLNSDFEEPITESEITTSKDDGAGQTTTTPHKHECENVQSTYIKNQYITVQLDSVSNKVTSVTLSNGVHINLDIQFFYYVSDDPDAFNRTDREPGVALFRAMENAPIPILDKVNIEIYKCADVVEELHVVYSNWTSFVVRLYDESPVLEVEWLVGPVPIEDKMGKEVFIRYTTNLVHDGVFYTDSNGRQTIKRIRNTRPMYETLNHDQVAGNFYPVTSKFSIEDLENGLRFSVFVDRAHGAASLADGEVDLMLQRRLLTDDMGQNIIFANDIEYDKGVVIRGKHHLYVSKLNHKPYNIFEKIFVKEKQLPPQVFSSAPNPYGSDTKNVWYKSKNQLTFLKTKLPLGVHLLTLEQWNDDTILLRIENFLEKEDTKRVPTKTVFLRELFTNIYINNVKETTLGGNVWLEDSIRDRLKWRTKEKFVKSFNGFYGVDNDVIEFLDDESPAKFKRVDLDKGVKLAPQQIRTFVCWFDYVEV